MLHGRNSCRCENGGDANIVLAVAFLCVSKFRKAESSLRIMLTRIEGIAE